MRPTQPGTSTTPAGKLELIQNLHSTHPRPEVAAAARISPVTAAAGLEISDISASTNQDNIHFIALVVVLISRLQQDHLSTLIKAPSQNLIANSGKRHQLDTFVEDYQSKRVIYKIACRASTA